MLDGEPTMVERTAYADWGAAAVEAPAVDGRSVMDSLAERSGIVAEYVEHLIDAMAAGGEDARLLGIRPGSPLLRQDTSPRPGPAARSSGPTTATGRGALSRWARRRAAD